MNRIFGQVCPKCHAVIPAWQFTRTANRCPKCGIRFGYTWKYYLLILVCAVLGSQSGNVVKAILGTDSLVLSLAFVLVVVLCLTTAVWRLVPGLVKASSGPDDGDCCT